MSWIIPAKVVGEHPSARVSTGEDYVINLVNEIGASPTWDNAAIFIYRDDWGGFYDHVVPQRVDGLGDPPILP